MKDLLHIPAGTLKSLGVLEWGYTEESRPPTMAHFEDWINQSYHGSLSYLADHRKELRRDIKNVYPDFQSALVFLFSYVPTKKYLLEHNQHRIAAYALGFDGEDYHYALKRRLDFIYSKLKEGIPHLEHLISLDTQPILERDLAHRAGLGWFGKNSMLINQREGSYFIIGSILLNQKLPLAMPTIDIDHCGHCRACVDACPTNAIMPESRTLIAQKCIATYTIETFKDIPPPSGFDLSRGEIFGCDICQDVCPWNNKPLQRSTSSFKIHPNLKSKIDFLLKASLIELIDFFEKLSNRGVKKSLQHTALDRPGRTGWLKNLNYRRPK
jgi:epoxyqueuosine reductase